MPWRLLRGWRAACPCSSAPSKNTSSFAAPRATCTTRRWASSALAASGGEWPRSLRAFKTRILATDMFPVEKPEYVEALWPADRLDDLLAEVDFLFLAVPLTPLTRSMIDASTCENAGAARP